MAKIRTCFQAISLAGASMIIGATAPASAQQSKVESEGAGSTYYKLNTIHVTIQKTEETLLNVPMAVSAFDAAGLEQLNIASASEIQFAVPNFQASQGNFTKGTVGIRGIVNAAVGASTDASIGAHVNSAPTFITPLLETELYDIERVEILRGPQGTLYGRNATGGVLNIITAKPTEQYEGNLTASYGSDNAQRLKGYVNLPGAGGIGLRIAGFVHSRDGYSTTLLQPDNRAVDVDDRSLYGYRATLGGQINDRASGFLMFDRYEEDDRRLRATKQLCTTDPRPFPFNQGCTPYEVEGLGFARDENGAPIAARPGLSAVNGSGTLSSILAGNIGLYDGLGVDYNEHSNVPADLRTYESAVLPSFKSDRDLLMGEFAYAFDNGLTLTAIASSLNLTRQSSDDFNKIYPSAPYMISALTPDLDGDGDGDWPGLAAFGEKIPYDSNLPETSDRPLSSELSTADNQTITGELRLQSDFDAFLNFNLGLIGIQSEIETDYVVFFTPAEAASVALQLAPDRSYFRIREVYELDALGAFGEVYLNLSDSIKLTAGLRYTSDEKSEKDVYSLLLSRQFPDALNGDIIPENPRKAKFEEVTGRAVIDWNIEENALTDATLLYASYARGYKGGGLNPKQPDGVVEYPDTFEPEFINAFEIGAKNTLLNGAADLNMSIFYYNYENYQISSILNQTSVNQNISAEVTGLEVEFNANLTHAFSLNAAIGLLDTSLGHVDLVDPYDQTAGDPLWITLKDPATTQNCIVDRQTAEILIATPFAATAALACTPGAVSSTIFALIDDPNTAADDAGNLAYAQSLEPDTRAANTIGIGGNRLPRAPETTLSIGAQYVWNMDAWTATLRGDFYQQSDMYTRVFNLEADRIKSWNNANASVSFENDNLGLNLEFYIKNILSDDQITDQYLGDASSGLTSNVFALDPRQYGIQLSKTW